jgi:tetratricopeptide (TPR) repeat protein
MRRDIVGTILTKERKRLNLTQQDIADRLQLGKTTVSYMERGLPTVGDDRYMQYATLLGIAEELFGIVDEAEKHERVILEELRHIEDIVSGNPEEALALLEDLDINMFHIAKVFATFLRGRIAFERQQRKEAKTLFREAFLCLDECPDLADSNLHAICLNDLGRLAFYEEDFQTALDYTEKAINLFKDEGNRTYYKPYPHLNKVIYLVELDRNEEACNELEFLYRHMDKFKDNIQSIIQIHEQYATLLFKSGSPLKALEYTQLGFLVAKKNRQYRRLFSICSLVGEIYVALKKLNEAKIHYRKALAFRKHVSDNPARIGITSLNYGKLLITLREHQTAEKQISNAVSLLEKAKNREAYLIDALITLAHLTKDEKLIQKADEIISNINTYKQLSIDIFLKICDFYESEDNVTKVKHYQTLIYHRLKEGASNEMVWKR